MTMACSYVNTPTIAPIRHVVSVPETIDFNPERIDLLAPFRGHGAEAADHDAEAGKIGKAAHRIEHDQPRARIERVGAEL